MVALYLVLLQWLWEPEKPGTTKQIAIVSLLSWASSAVVVCTDRVMLCHLKISSVMGT